MSSFGGTVFMIYSRAAENRTRTTTTPWSRTTTILQPGRIFYTFLGLMRFIFPLLSFPAIWRESRPFTRDTPGFPPSLASLELWRSGRE